MRTRIAALVLAAVVAVAVIVVRQRGGTKATATPLPAASPGPRAAAAIERFFTRYVEADGRVVRRDQGGDTVSEGQAYALALAAASSDRARFERVWAWTRANLQRPDGLLSWRWEDGRVSDINSATDADVDAARALVLAADRFGASDLRREAERLARAVLDHETVEVDDARVLVAGPWATGGRVVNPSYVSPCAYQELEAITGDGRWAALLDGDLRLLDSLLAGGRLPPDWAEVDEKGSVRPIGSPNEREGEPRYGLDAARIPARLAEGCDGRGPELAARLWPRLRDLDAGGAAVAYHLDGRRAAPGDHPLGLVGAAASAKAAGEDGATGRLLDRAAELERRHPSYYGAAWVALGELLLGGERDG